MRKVAIIIHLLILFTVVKGQEFPPIEKEDFKLEHKDDFKEAWRKLKIADGYYEAMESSSYRSAIEFYDFAYDYNGELPALNYKLGVCHLLSTFKTKSIPFFEKAYKLKADVAMDIEYLMARAYQYNYDFEKAIEYFNKFKKRISSNTELKQRYGEYLEKYKGECKTAIILMNEPTRAFIDNIGKKINSKHKDHTPVITADESILFFTSRRQGFAEDDIDPYDGEFYENIYVSYNEYGLWSEPKMIKKVSSKKQHDATISITPDGQHMFIYRSDDEQGDIYESKLKGDKWSSPKKMPKIISSKYHETSACLSYDGTELFFTSNRPEQTLGESDIFVCTKNEKGEWANVKNIGNVINTKYKEESVFLMPDGRTMFFSSEGHNTMGGLDIFKSTRDENGNWSKPENLGVPINTPDHDVFLVLSANGKHGYYSTVRDDGQGSNDIHLITFLGPEKPHLNSNEDNLVASLANPVKETMVQPPMALTTIRLTILKGTIRDKDTQQPLEANIEIVDNEKGEVVYNSLSNESTGKYLVTLPSGKNYGIRVNKTDYMFHSENFDIPQTTSYQEVTKDIDLMSVAVGAKIILRNVFFDFDKATLRPLSKTELDKLIAFMNDYPSVKIEISGHTDSKGSDAYNLKLSDDRSQSVVNYLVKNGIANERLTFKGYGETQPIATNDTDEGRQQNRRVEAKILSK